MRYQNPEYDLMHPFSTCKNKIYFRVKSKWLEQTDFVDGEFYQGDLELKFYSMNCPDLSRDNRFRLIPSYLLKEDYWAKLVNVKHVRLEDVD